MHIQKKSKSTLKKSKVMKGKFLVLALTDRLGNKTTDFVIADYANTVTFVPESFSFSSTKFRTYSQKRASYLCQLCANNNINAVIVEEE